jgi:deoxyribodipyrimidine photolyase-like uncharacterized protein
MSGVLRFVLGDQLNRGISSLKDLEPERDRVLMVEVEDEATYVPSWRNQTMAGAKPSVACSGRLL